jgi:choline transport protein
MKPVQSAANMGEAKEMKSSSEIERRMFFPNRRQSLDIDRITSEITTQEGEVQDLSHHLVGLDLQPDDARNMSKLEIVSAGWVISNSWAGIAATFALAVSQGGPVTLVYGPIIIFVLVGLCALTLGELASVYPTAGGQYHWTSILAPKSWSRELVSALRILFVTRELNVL